MKARMRKGREEREEADTERKTEEVKKKENKVSIISLESRKRVQPWEKVLNSSSLDESLVSAWAGKHTKVCTCRDAKQWADSKEGGGAFVHKHRKTAKCCCKQPWDKYWLHIFTISINSWAAHLCKTGIIHQGGDSSGSLHHVQQSCNIIIERRPKVNIVLHMLNTPSINRHLMVVISLLWMHRRRAATVTALTSRNPSLRWWWTHFLCFRWECRTPAPRCTWGSACSSWSRSSSFLAFARHISETPWRTGLKQRKEGGRRESRRRSKTGEKKHGRIKLLGIVFTFIRMCYTWKSHLDKAKQVKSLHFCMQNIQPARSRLSLHAGCMLHCFRSMCR